LIWFRLPLNRKAVQRTLQQVPEEGEIYLGRCVQARYLKGQVENAGLVTHFRGVAPSRASATGNT
jgi:hypothetical protein